MASRVTPSPELADENTGTALQTEDNELDDIDGYVGHGDSGHLLLSHKAHHKGVHEAEGGGDKILQHYRHCQREDPLVKARLPVKIVEIHSLCCFLRKDYSIGIRVS